MEKPLQCLFMFSFSIGESNILQTVLTCPFFSVFIFSLPFQKDNNSNTVYVLGHEYILGPSQSSFQPSPNGSG